MADHLPDRLLQHSLVASYLRLQVVQSGRLDGVRRQIELDELRVQATENVTHGLDAQDSLASVVGEHVQHDACQERRRMICPTRGADTITS